LPILWLQFAAHIWVNPGEAERTHNSATPVVSGFAAKSWRFGLSAVSSAMLPKVGQHPST
jgi:hypothetical protein